MADPQAVLKTNRGDIVLNLFPNHAPETVANFTGLATGEKDYDAGNGRSGPFYDGLGFQRVISAMANAGPGTNGSQFFITVGATTWLNFKHTIFGEVADQASRDVVDAIATTQTGPGDRPVEPVVIETVEIREA